MNPIALKSFVGLWQVSPEKTQITGLTKPITFRHRKLKSIACKYNPLVSGRNLRVVVIGGGPKLLGIHR
ncbi:hypothetical protein QN277_000270 [Acacia crassicarpa]|uniref:Uncharacterized protein n=1 Tax=Acacia crassicarpa TaxID=499986 RepID=A0AAE1N784_9FABA|nr:hypothetical protein QN277_000270 [Acacia crassicarpa]